MPAFAFPRARFDVVIELADSAGGETMFVTLLQQSVNTGNTFRKGGFPSARRKWVQRQVFALPRSSSLAALFARYIGFNPTVMPDYIDIIIEVAKHGANQPSHLPGIIFGEDPVVIQSGPPRQR